MGGRLALGLDADGRLAGCGIGTLEQRLPGPHPANGRIGHVVGVVTDPARRRQGHSRAIMRALQDWFRDREAARVDLYASAEGEPLSATSASPTSRTRPCTGGREPPQPSPTSRRRGLATRKA